MSAKDQQLNQAQDLINTEQEMLAEVRGVREELKGTNNLLYGIMVELQRANNIRERANTNTNLADLVQYNN